MVLRYRLCIFRSFFGHLCQANDADTTRILLFDEILVIFKVIFRLASLGVAFGLEHLVLEPLLTLCFGNFRFFRMKGFYYDFRLG